MSFLNKQNTLFLLSGLALGSSLVLFSKSTPKNIESHEPESTLTASQNKTLVNTEQNVTEEVKLTSLVKNIDQLDFNEDLEKKISPYINKLSSDQIKNELDILFETLRKGSKNWQTTYHLISMLLHKWSEKSPHQALEYVKNLGNERPHLTQSIFEGWSSVDPINAVEYYKENNYNPDDRDLYYSVRSLMNNLAYYDPEKALNWAKELSTQVEAQSCLNIYISLFDSLTEKSPELALKKLKELPDIPQLRHSVQASIIQTWMSQDKDAVYRWIQTLSPEDKVQAQASAIKTLSTINPQEALNQFTSLNFDDKTKTAVIDQLSRSIATENPTQALEWLNSQTNLETKTSEQISNIIKENVSSHYTEIKNWISALPDGDNKIQAAISFSESSPNSDYSDSLNILSSLNSTEQKDKDLIQEKININYWSWEHYDAAQAKQWLESSSLSDEIKQRLSR